MEKGCHIHIAQSVGRARSVVLVYRHLVEVLINLAFDTSSLFSVKIRQSTVLFPTPSTMSGGRRSRKHKCFRSAIYSYLTSQLNQAGALEDRTPLLYIQAFKKLSVSSLYNRLH